MTHPDAARTFAERFGLDEDAQEPLSFLLSGEVPARSESGPVGLRDAYEPPVDLPADSHQALGGHGSSPEGDVRGAGRGLVSSRRGLDSQRVRLVRPWP
jgi:hypothetical protein